MSDTETRLRDFLAWVRIRRPINGAASVDDETLEIVAQGIEQYLAGQRPWPKKRGNKPDPDLMWRCYYLTRFSETGEFMPRHKMEGGDFFIVGEQLHLSADAVEHHVRRAEEKIKTQEGRADFCLWVGKEKGATLVRFQPAPSVSSQNND